LVQSNSGEGIGVGDNEYARIGAEIVDAPEEIICPRGTGG
jgi:alanine dehydrogenase